jgi:hypothetical protein
VRLVLYVGMVFVCCQLTWEWHFVLPAYVGMAFCVASLRRNVILCCQLT